MDVVIYLNLIFILAGITSFIDITSLDEKYKKILLLALFFMCWCVTPIFGEMEPMLSIWSDRGAYARIFEEVPILTEIISDFDQLGKIHGEYGFLFLISLIKTIFPFASARLFFIIVATITLALNYYSIVCYTNMRLSAFLCYYASGFVILDLFYLRTGLATAIVLYFIRFATRRQFWKFFVGWLLACSIHVAAIPAILIYFFCKINWSYFKLAGIVCLALGFINLRWIDVLAKILNDPRLDYYTTRVHVHTVETVVVFTVLFGCLICINSIKLQNKDININNIYYRTLQGMFALTILTKSLAGEMMVLQRFVMVLNSSQYFLLPMLLFVPLKYQKSRVVIYICVMMIIIGLNLRWYGLNGLGLLSF